MPVVSSALCLSDRLGSWKARWGIGRMSYLVPPGLYAIGMPGAEAPVVVTANYKMSYDIVRSELAGRSVWLLVLETFGINVWCAAGKGTFGTDEVVRRVQATGLDSVVSHRQLLLPILGAPGVAAHAVAKRTGFRVRYATIRAQDLPAFLDNGMVATPAMRQLTFTVAERLILTPIELVSSVKWAVPFTVALVLLTGLSGLGFSLTTLLPVIVACVGTVLAGAVVAPVLLPWLPGKSFAVKGAEVGFAWAAILTWWRSEGLAWHDTMILFLAVPAVSAFLSLNFTGSTPFTSRSGVKKEMRLSLPVMAAALVVALIVWCAGRVF
ncbi:MAG: acetyl-CoA synthase subunit gamma [Desulfuromonadales bacterium]|nr:MAG: acetyl-CoA synthase subunit gamma [Desulfuromonadales bacterium]